MRSPVAAVVILACLTTLASAMTPKKPQVSPACAMPAQTPDPMRALQTLEPPITAPEAAPPRVSMPGAMTSQAMAYLLSNRGEQGPRISFPANAATAQAIRRFASRSISSRPNHCAGSMREAMGWGLGDAHQWVSLADMGFNKRVGEPAHPGDIVVWPFTFGSRNSQHIGIAVGTDNGVKLLSNLSGSICLSPLVPGYRAFYRYEDAPGAPPQDMEQDRSGGLARLELVSEPEG